MNNEKSDITCYLILKYADWIYTILSTLNRIMQNEERKHVSSQCEKLKVKNSFTANIS